MPARSVSCPSCGASREIHNPGILMFVCEYCGNAVYWDQERVQAAGEQSVLPEGFSRLYRGAAGSLHQKRFVVAGRVRYSFGRGFWDEWYLEMEDGALQWLTEDNHELALQRRVETRGLVASGPWQPGQPITYRDRPFVVQEVGRAECIGVEGELPRFITSGESYPYVDASSPDGRSTLGLEYDDGDRPSLFLGKWLKHAELKLDEEGVDW